MHDQEYLDVILFKLNLSSILYNTTSNLPKKDEIHYEMFNSS